MSAIKKLAGQTAIYGGSTIIGRLLNYLLVPLHVWALTTNEYGSLSILYSYVAFFIVLLTFGMETTFFRFVNKAENKERIFNQAFSIVTAVNVVVVTTLVIFSSSIAVSLDHPEYQPYVVWFAFILAADAISSLLMAKLRFQNKAKRFALVQLSSIGLNIILNVLFITVYFDENVPGSFGVAYIFFANLCSSLLKPVLLFKELKAIKLSWNKTLAKAMFIFAIPLIIAGFAGIINEVIDRILLKKIIAQEQGVTFAESQVGIYSANYKLSILITLFITAFRYAAEPFFFSKEKDKDKDKVYAMVMTYFVIVVTFIFLLISFNLPIFKWFITNPAYWEGLKIVPVLLLANVFLGVYYNQSIWYKLANKTRFGAYIAIGGALITLSLNFLLIPIMGYMGSAITTLIVYFTMMVASYIGGQKYYPIKYNLRKVGLYIIASIALLGISRLIEPKQVDFTWGMFIINAILLLIFIGIVLFIERPFQRIKQR